VSHFQLLIYESASPKRDRIAEITRRMNERFRTQEQFEMQIDTICLDIAMAMKGTMDHLGQYIRHGDILIFNFTFLTPDQIIHRLEKEPL